MHVPKAASQLQRTIKFRHEMETKTLNPTLFNTFLERGELYIAGHVPSGEPVLV
jgi:hypothetical protein